MNRRNFANAMAAAVVLEQLDRAQTPAAAGGDHEMAGMSHPMPDRPEQIAILVYPGMTALDMVGPQQVLGYTIGAKVFTVWKDKNPITTDTGLVIIPSTTFGECPSGLDVLMIPGGGMGTAALMGDRETIGFVKSRGASAQWVTSVCTGALVLGAADLLRGYKATTHWAVRDLLPLFGATPVEARVVEDRNRVTAGGVTSGIDFGLRIAARLRGDDYGRALELQLEYDPQPPFHSGTPAKAGPKVVAALGTMNASLNQAFRRAVQTARSAPKE